MLQALQIGGPGRLAAAANQPYQWVRAGSKSTFFKRWLWWGAVAATHEIGDGVRTRDQHSPDT